MISYELAKKLKEAGFPQKNPVYVSGRIPNEEFVSYPSLSELIDACGADFDSLQNWDTTWNATALSSDNKEVGNENGSTPEEAVARLWLRLNEKEV